MRVVFLHAVGIRLPGAEGLDEVLRGSEHSVRIEGIGLRLGLEPRERSRHFASPLSMKAMPIATPTVAATTHRAASLMSGQKRISIMPRPHSPPRARAVSGMAESNQIL